MIIALHVVFGGVFLGVAAGMMLLITYERESRLATDLRRSSFWSGLGNYRDVPWT